MLKGKNGETRWPSQPKVQNQIKKTKTTRKERRDLLYSNIPEWLQEFRENLVDDRVPEHRDSHLSSSSHEPSVEPLRSPSHHWIQQTECDSAWNLKVRRLVELHFDKFPTPATFACWKIRFKTEVCTCSQFPTEAKCNGSKKWSWLIQWMNWDLRHLLVVFQCRILKYLMQGLLQRWTKSSIILISQEESVWRNKRPRSRIVSFVADRLLPLIYDYFRVTGVHDSVENYADLFTISLRNDDIQEFDSKWDGILFQWRKSHLMTSWKDCTNWEYESLRNSTPYWNCMTWRLIRRKLDLIITDWRQWWKEVSSKIYETGILRQEMEIMRQTPWSRIKG